LAAPPVKLCLCCALTVLLSRHRFCIQTFDDNCVVCDQTSVASRIRFRLRYCCACHLHPCTLHVWLGFASSNSRLALTRAVTRKPGTCCDHWLNRPSVQVVLEAVISCSPERDITSCQSLHCEAASLLQHNQSWELQVFSCHIGCSHASIHSWVPRNQRLKHVNDMPRSLGPDRAHAAAEQHVCMAAQHSQCSTAACAVAHA